MIILQPVLATIAKRINCINSKEFQSYPGQHPAIIAYLQPGLRTQT